MAACKTAGNGAPDSSAIAQQIAELGAQATIGWYSKIYAFPSIKDNTISYRTLSALSEDSIISQVKLNSEDNVNLEVQHSIGLSQDEFFSFEIE